jgi:hypothetical protein
LGLHICHVGRRGKDSRGEWVEIANDGALAVALTGLELTDYTETQQHPHIYTFPRAQGGGDLMLAASNSAYVFTRTGTAERLSDGDLILYWGRGADVWNNPGDVAYLRHSDGTFIDHMTVGEPKRHPGGH